MICKSCGRTLNNDFVLCPYCGSKIHASKELPDEISFSVAGRQIVVSGTLIEYNNLRKRFVEKAVNLENEYVEYYNAREHTFDGLFEEEIPEAVNSAIRAAKFGVSVLMEYGIDEIDEDELADRIVSANGSIKEALEPIFSRVLEIAEVEDSLSSYRDIQRMGRSHWEGGGFGISGAIKGALTAGALNAGTSIIRGLGDSITDSNDKEKISKLKRELANDGKTYSCLRNTVYKYSFAVFYCVKDILISNNLIEPFAYNRKRVLARVRNNMEQYRQQRNDEAIYNRTMDVLCECLQTAPYESDIYYHLYVTTQSEKSEIHTLAKYFGVERRYGYLLRRADTNLLNMIRDSDENTLEDLEGKLDDINLLLHENPYIDADDYLKELNKKVDDHKRVINYQAKVDDAVERNDIDLMWKYADSGNVYAEQKLISYYNRLYRAAKEAGLDAESLLNPVIGRSKYGNPLASFIVAHVRSEEHSPRIIQLAKDCYKARKYVSPFYIIGEYAIDTKNWDKYGITKQQAIWFVDRAADMLYPRALDKAYDLFSFGKWFVVDADKVRAERYDRLRKLYSEESQKRNLQIEQELQRAEMEAVAEVQDLIKQLCSVLNSIKSNKETNQSFQSTSQFYMETANIAKLSETPIVEPPSVDVPAMITKRNEYTHNATSDKMPKQESDTSYTDSGIVGKSKLLAGILSVIFGPYGIHWFYLRKPLRGISNIAIFVILFLLDAVLPHVLTIYVILCIGEGIYLLCAKREVFERYVCKKRSVMANVLVIGLVLIALFAMIIVDPSEEVPSVNVSIPAEENTLREPVKGHIVSDSASENDSISDELSLPSPTTPETELSIYEFMIATVRDDIDICLASNPPDMDKLREDYRFLLDMYINEGIFKSYANGYFTGEYEIDELDFLLEKMGGISTEMKAYFDESEVDEYYIYCVKMANRSFDENRFDFESRLIGDRASPDIDAMWEAFIASSMGLDSDFIYNTDEPLYDDLPEDDEQQYYAYNGSQHIDYSLYDLYFYANTYYSNDNGCVIELLVLPTGTDYHMNISWSDGREDWGVVTPGVLSTLNEGTVVMLDLETNGSIALDLDGTGVEYLWAAEG